MKLIRDLIDRKPIFDAAKARGAEFKTNAHVEVLDNGIDRALGDLMTGSAAEVQLVDEKRLGDVIRGLFGSFTQPQWDAIKAVLDGQPEPAPSPEGVTQVGLSKKDFDRAASKLSCTVAQIRAVDEVESGGGWFTDVRADILNKDGPGGFIGGPHLPKILFEAHKFDKYSNGRFRSSHPNLSSSKWNRALYVGGQAEWVRLYEAMMLDRTAALMSASVGRYQIMGFNYKLAGFANVELFWDAMKTSEAAHLDAFVQFVINSGLADELRRVSNVHADCIPFARGYNGAGYAQHNPPYNVRIARAHAKFSRL